MRLIRNHIFSFVTSYTFFGDKSVQVKVINFIKQEQIYFASY